MSCIETALDPALLDLLMEDFLDAIPAGPDGGERRRLAARAMVLAMKPADACEAMLAMHAVAAHYAALDAWKRATQPELDDKTAMRMRASAAGAARMMQAALRALQARRKAEAQVTDAPPVSRRAPRLAAGAAPEAARPEAPRPAATQHPLPTAPGRAAPAETEVSLPKPNREGVTMEERQAAYRTGALAGP